MIRGLYAAASGMITGVLRQELIAHDIANANTPGYKQATLSPFRATLLNLRRLSTTQVGVGTPEVGSLGTGIYPAPVDIDFTQGPLRETRRALDVAMEGEGFFQVQTPEGPRFTRDGRFHRDVDGNLVTTRGYPVLDADGQPIQLPEGEVTIRRDGVISVDGEEVGGLGVFQPPLESLERSGDILFASTAEEAPPLVADVRVQQGFLENSNMDAAATMVEMMLVARSYEASQRLVQLQDQVLARTIDIGRVG